MMWCANIIRRSIKAPQKSIPWLKARYDMLTSSEAASALDCNRYESSSDLIRKKVLPMEQQSIFSSHATAWGEKYEPIAKRIFESDKALHITDVGLVPHETIPWLGASPDGLVSDGRLIEIKCPFYRRVVKDNIPYHYWIQVQIQLEVCDVEECYFVQCMFEENPMNFTGVPDSGISHNGYHSDKTAWYLKNYTINIIKRDREWFKKVFPVLSSFWKKVGHYRLHGVGLLDADLAGKQAFMNLETNAISIQQDMNTNTNNTTIEVISPDVVPTSPLMVSLPVNPPKPREDNLNAIQPGAEDVIQSFDLYEDDAREDVRKDNQSTLTTAVYPSTTGIPSTVQLDVLITPPDTTMDITTPNVVDLVSDIVDPSPRYALNPHIHNMEITDLSDASRSVIENAIQGVTVEPVPPSRIDWSEWVSPSDTRNFLLKDPLLDWLNLYGKNLITDNPKYDRALKNYELDFKSSAPYIHYLVQSGNEFENAVMTNIKNRFADEVVTIAEPHHARDPAVAALTVAAIKAGTPIIYHGLLHDAKTKTYGIADLIVRSDYVNKLFTNPVMPGSLTKHKCKFSDKWHYVIIDIKHSMLMLRADGVHLLNSGHAAAYKGQVHMYNEILSTIQEYKSDLAYILGRRWSYTTKGERFDGNGWFDRAGVVDFASSDANIPKLVKEAIAWVRQLRKEGSKWTINPPSNANLYPNMCNEQDTPWHSLKKVLAESVGEITDLWQCGINNRDIAFSNGIKSWRDKKCSAQLVGICGPKQGPCLDAIIHINKQTTTQKILPRKISQKLPRRKIEFFLDFETSNDVSGPIDPNMPFTTSESFIYMIGLGWTVTPSNEWHYTCLVADTLSQPAEKEIFMIMHDKIFEILEGNNALEDYTIYHWSNAERVIYDNTLMKYYSDLSLYNEHFHPIWFDLCDLFRQEPITVKGALNFSLKSVAPAMYKHGFIETIWDENGVTNGLNAMIKAIECSEDAKRKGFVMSEHPIMKEIVKYNEVDCKVMMEILRYIRNNLTVEPSRGNSTLKSRLVGKRKQLAEAAGEETRFIHDVPKPVIVIDDQEDETQSPSTPTTSKKREGGKHPAAPKKRRRIIKDDSSEDDH